MPEVPLKIVVCIYDTFENNSELKHEFTTYLKKTCILCLGKYFSDQKFPIISPLRKTFREQEHYRHKRVNVPLEI